MTNEQKIQAQLKYSNLLAWHEAGMTGKGVNVWNAESETDHGKACTQRIKDAAPDCTVYQAGLSLMTSNGAIVARCKYQDKWYDVEEFVKEFKIRIVTRSTGGKTVDELKSKYWNALKEKYNLMFFTAAGNEGMEGLTGAFPVDVAIYVGACGLSDSGLVKRLNYSSIGEELDFVTFPGNLNGTSFCGPYLAGTAANLIQLNNSITQAEAYEYFKAHAKDLGDNTYNGWGIPIMGDPYEEVEDTEVTKTNIKVGGQIKSVNRILYKGENYIRLRDFEDVLGVVDVEYDEANKLPIIED